MWCGIYTWCDEGVTLPYDSGTSRRKKGCVAPPVIGWLMNWVGNWVGNWVADELGV